MRKLVLTAVTLLLLSTNCFSQQKILGGSDVDISEIPQIVQIHDRIEWNGAIIETFLGGGVIINCNTILTAAHVTDGLYPLFIRAGANRTTGFEGQTINVVEIIQHPESDSIQSAFEADIALLRLENPLEFNDKVQPAVLANPSNTNNSDLNPGTQANIFGWGRCGLGCNSTHLKGTTLPIISESEFNNIGEACTYEISWEYPLQSDEIPLHAESKGSGAGDSGGPLVINEKVYGITKYGSCYNQIIEGNQVVDIDYSNEHKLSIYTNLIPYHSWIQANTFPCCGSTDKELRLHSEALSTEFDGTRCMPGNIVISNGATLTVTGDVYMGSEHYIKVERGGRLIVDGGKISACYENWKGIFVEGYGNEQEQTSDPFYEVDWIFPDIESGVVAVINGGQINKAKTAINCHRMNEGWNSEYYGGLVYCDDAKFLQNNRAVAFYPYNGNDNSSFTNTQFANYKTGASHWANTGVEYQNCTFDNHNNAAIYGIDASMIVDNGCRFGGNEYGVHLLNTQMGLGGVSIKNSYLNNNSNHIKLTGLNGLVPNEIENNFISRGLIGVYFDGNSHFDINENDFSYLRNFGSIIDATGEAFNLEVENSFYNCWDGIHIEHKNDDYHFDANCFHYTVLSDVMLTKQASIHEMIGSEFLNGTDQLSGGAKNCFSHNGAEDVIIGPDVEPFTYWYPESNYGACRFPESLDDSYKDIAQESTDYSCEIIGFAGWTPQFDICSFNKDSISLDSFLVNLETEIDSIKSDGVTFYESIRIKRLKRCIRKTVQDTIKIILEEEDTIKAIDILEKRTLFDLSARAISLAFDNGNYSYLDDFINRHTVTDNAEADYLEFMDKKRTIETTRDDTLAIQRAKDKVLEIANKRHTYSAYARGYWAHLTGEIILHPMTRVERRETETRESFTIDPIITPNPSSGYIDVELEGVRDITGVEIFSLFGQKLLSTDVSKGINIADLNSGIYLVNVLTEIGMYQTMFYKQ